MQETLERGRPAAPDPSALRREIEGLGPWFHNLHLPGGVQTLPDSFIGGDFPRFKWLEIAPHLPQDLSGWRVLDVGCNAGFYSFELARRGASVLAIDVEELYLNQARWAARVLGLDRQVEFRHMGVYQVAQLAENFDLEWFMGVFYHPRYPMLALARLAQDGVHRAPLRRRREQLVGGEPRRRRGHAARQRPAHPAAARARDVPVRTRPGQQRAVL